MIGRTNGVSGNGLVTHKAVAKIRALTGSTVTLSSNGTELMVFEPSAGIPHIDNPLISEYYYSVPPSKYGYIDIVAEHKDVEYPHSISITSQGFYETTVPMNLFLYKDGNECTDITGGWYCYNNGQNTGSYLLVGDSDQGSVCVTNNAIGMKYFNTVHYNGYRMRRADWNTQWNNSTVFQNCGLYSSKTSGGVATWSYGDVGVLNYDQNVSAIDQPCYVRISTGASRNCQGRCEQIYLVLS